MSRTRFIITTLAAIILLVAGNIIARQLLTAQIDLTQEKLYSLSYHSDSLLGALDEPVTLRFFYTPTQANGLPIFQSYAQRVHGLLERITNASNGQITLEDVTPVAFSEAEDLAVTHGLQGIPVDGAGSQFYFGLSAESTTDDRGTIAFFDPARSRFLEYDVMKLIHDVSQPERARLGIISTLPIRGSGSATQFARRGAWAVLDKLKESFDVKQLATNSRIIADNIDTLVLIHPHNLGEATIYAIDQYLMRGGKALIFMDARVQLPDVDIRQSSLPRLLDHWGIEFSSDRLVAEKDAAISVSQSNAASRLASFPNVAWLQLDESYLSDDAVITAELNIIRLIESGYFTMSDTSTLTATPLITTTPAAMSILAKSMENGGNLLALYKNYVPEGTPFTLATQLNGTLTSAFNDTALAAANDDHRATATKPTSIILAGDADMLRDELWIEQQNFYGQTLDVPNADNGAFVLNAVDYLSSNSALIGLRSRGMIDRRFDALDHVKADAELAFREEENRLQDELKALETQLRTLQTQQHDAGELFTDAQQREISNFRDSFTSTRKQLRAVQRDLNRDIQNLGGAVALINIIVIPFILLLCAFFLPSWLRRPRTIRNGGTS